ncbi:MAG: hypothetical protein MZU95_00695 [Desulfomicrobium escambiense]|nr:hypothetical protein [Desulfomicrobium escambiense]
MAAWAGFFILPARCAVGHRRSWDAAEVSLLRRLYGQNILYQILMTYGIAIAGRELIVLLYGPVGKSFDQPELLTGVISIAGIFFPICGSLFSQSPSC